MSDSHPVTERYLDRLDRSIAALDPADRREILGEIRNHIAEAVAAGKPLAVVLESLGPAEGLARAYEIELLLHPRRNTGLRRAERFLRVAALVALSSLVALVPVAMLAVMGFGFTLTGALLMVLAALETAGIHVPGTQFNGVSPAWAIPLGAAVTIVGLLSLIGLRWSVRLLASLVRRVLPRNAASSSPSRDLSTRLALALMTIGLASLPLSAQTPSTAPLPECRDAADIKFVCGQSAPEDLVVVPGDRWVIASSFSGSGGVKVVRVADRTTTAAFPSASAKVRHDVKAYPECPGVPDTSALGRFTTHGLHLLPGAGNVHRVFAVGHGARESIEVFELDVRGDAPVFTWTGCVIAPMPIGLNSVRGLPDGGFITTNWLPRGGDATAMPKMMSGERNGELWEWHTASGWQKVPGSEAAGANGLEMSDDGRWLYVAAWGSQSFFRMSRGQITVDRMEIPLGFRVDNIRWARDGSLLAAGQGGTVPAQASVVVRIDPKAMSVREVVRRPNSDAFGGGTTAVEVGSDFWIGSFRGDRLAVLPGR